MIPILLVTLFFSIIAIAAPQPMARLSRPNAADGPTEVSALVWILDIDSIDSSSQNFAANVFVALRWKDPRLAGDRTGVEIYNIEQIWNPRIQIANESGIVRRTLPEILTVQPDGTVIYRQRFVGPFSQPLNLNKFPFDTQVFRLHFVSPTNSPDNIRFIRDEGFIAEGLPKAAGIAADISLPDWLIEGIDTKALPYVTAPTAPIAGYAFDFTAKRDSWHYVWKVILPLLLIVIMSWSVFWIDPSNAGTQIAVATTSMLTLIAYRFAIDSQVPRVPYMTRIDQFILVGTILVFLTLAQVVFTSRIHQLGHVELAKRIDRVSRIVFPLAFIIGLSIALNV